MKYHIRDKLRPEHSENSRNYTEKGIIRFLSDLKKEEEKENEDVYMTSRISHGVSEFDKVDNINYPLWARHFDYEIEPIYKDLEPQTYMSVLIDDDTILQSGNKEDIIDSYISLIESFEYLGLDSSNISIIHFSREYLSRADIHYILKRSRNNSLSGFVRTLKSNFDIMTPDVFRRWIQKEKEQHPLS